MNRITEIAEQEELLDDICNDVLGYGPLEPLLARDDIAELAEMKRALGRFALNAPALRFATGAAGVGLGLSHHLGGLSLGFGLFLADLRQHGLGLGAKAQQGLDPAGVGQKHRMLARVALQGAALGQALRLERVEQPLEGRGLDSHLGGQFGLAGARLLGAGLRPGRGRCLRTGRGRLAGGQGQEAQQRQAAPEAAR